MKKAMPIIIILAIAAAIIAVVVVKSVTKKPEPDTRAKIAVIGEAAAGHFWESVRRGAEMQVEGTDYRIYWEGPDNKGGTAEQIRIIEEFIEQGVSGVVLAPVESSALLPSIERLSDANIPCAIIGARVESESVVCCVGTNNYIAGLIAARRMGKILGGKGKIAVVKYMPDSGRTTDRENGFADTIKNEFSQIQIVEAKYGMDTVETASAAVAELLSEHADIDGLFACNASTSVGALKALGGRGRAGRIKMVGFGVDGLLVDGLRSGSVDSFVAENACEMGCEAVKAVIAALEGGDVTKNIEMKVVLVTKDNVDTAEVQELLGGIPQR